MYDGILRVLPDKVSVIAYADHVALIVVAESIKEMCNISKILPRSIAYNRYNVKLILHIRAFELVLLDRITCGKGYELDSIELLFSSYWQRNRAIH